MESIRIKQLAVRVLSRLTLLRLHLDEVRHEQLVRDQLKPREGKGGVVVGV